MNSLEAVNDSITLEQRLSEGPLETPEALRLALMLAEELRRSHDEGRAPGRLSPGTILLKPDRMELSGAQERDDVTPYTAPEILQGCPADERGDVFAFGKVLLEMLAGRRALESHTCEERAQLAPMEPAPLSGIRAVDRLIARCIAKDPSARYQRMKSVILELKLLTVGVRRVGEERSRQRALDVLRSDVQRLEADIEARFQAYEQRFGDVRRSSGEAIEALREEAKAVEARFTAVEGRANGAEQRLEGLDRNLARLGQTSQDLDERTASAQQDLEALRGVVNALQDHAASQSQQFSQALKKQEAAIEALRVAHAQSEDLIERTVEALEVLQTIVLDRDMM